MKKLIIFVSLFGIVSFSITGFLINKANSPEKNNSNNDVQVVEKTLDLNGRYNTNDLIIEYEENTNYTEFIKDFKIPQIKGLKDKTVEEKINNEMKNTILAKVDEITKIENLDEYYIEEYKYWSNEHYPVRVYIQEHCNFANVISLTANIDYDVENNTSLEKLIFNYELVNGEKLKLEDLFVKDADITEMLRKVLYKVIAGESSSYDSRDNLYYDIENEMWVTNGLIYDEESNDYIRGEKEYIPFHTEDKINQKIIKYMKEREKQFEFTEAAVSFVLGEYDSHRLHFTDIADQVVIYDKYLTEESIYEKDDVGQENLLNCTTPRSNFLLQKYGLESDNIWYDLSIPNYYGQIEKYPFKASYNKLCEKAKELGNEKLEEYIEIAKQNPEKFYILSLTLNVSFVEVYNEDDKYNNIISMTISEAFETIELGEVSKEDIISDIFKAYRYSNVSMYPSGLDCYYQGGWNNYKELRQNDYSNIVKKDITIAYDARNMEQIEDVGELFKQEANYKKILEDKTIEILSRVYNSDEVNEIMQDVSYDISAYGLLINVPENYADGYRMQISFFEFDEEILSIYELE